MKNFMIGQYGGFDRQKFQRDFKKGFYGIEACLFHSEQDINHLVEASKEDEFHIGIHYPFRAPTNILVRDALFMAKDETLRQKAFDEIQREWEYLATVKPAYILFHYPKPVILDNRVNWDRWRFTDKSEYIFENEYSYEEFTESSMYLFEWLQAKSLENGIVPVLEFDALNRYIYETDFLETSLRTYNRIKLCLDTARLHFQNKIDPHFDAKLIIKRYAKYAEIIHLSNVRVQENVEHNHHPVLPELRTEEGWAPIEEYLTLIANENKNVKILFEHRSDLISEEQLDRCYTWVDSLLQRKGSEGATVGKKYNEPLANW